MNLRRALIDRRAPRALIFATIGVGALLLVIAIWWTVDLVRWRFAGLDANAEAKGHLTAINEVRASLIAFDAGNQRRVPAELEVSEVMNSVVQRVGAKHSVKIKTFNSEMTAGQYISQYTASSTESDWKQVGISATISGPAPQVMAAFDSMLESNVAFEITTLRLTRVSVQDDGQAIIDAQLSANVLCKSEGGA